LHFVLSVVLGQGAAWEDVGAPAAASEVMPAIEVMPSIPFGPRGRTCCRGSDAQPTPKARMTAQKWPPKRPKPREQEIQKKTPAKKIPFGNEGAARKHDDPI